MVTISKFRTEDETREYCLAPDLSVWTPKRTLANIVANAVRTVDENTLHPAISVDTGRVPPPRILLALVTYCYAIGAYRSERVEHSVASDEVLHSLCGGYYPDSALIRRFRHLNRAAIEQCLEKVCMVVWKIKNGNWQWHAPVFAAQGSFHSAHRIDPLFQAQVICEVKERLNKAERLDYGHEEDNPFAEVMA